MTTVKSGSHFVFCILSVFCGVSNILAMEAQPVQCETLSFRAGADRLAGLMYYDRLSEGLYEQIDKQRNSDAWTWVVQYAECGVIPCCYFVVRNQIKKLGNNDFKHEVPPAELLMNIVVLLMLVKIDSDCWLTLKGGVLKDRDKVCSVYMIFKNKINKLLGKLKSVFDSCNFVNVVHDAAAKVTAMYDQNIANRYFVPYGWVYTCAEAQSIFRTRIMYGEPEYTIVSAEYAQASNVMDQRKALVEQVAAQLERLYVSSSINFLAGQNDFPWSSGLTMPWGTLRDVEQAVHELSSSFDRLSVTCVGKPRT